MMASGHIYPLHQDSGFINLINGMLTYFGAVIFHEAILLEIAAVLTEALVSAQVSGLDLKKMD